MDARSIIEALGKEQRVEKLIERISDKALTPELKDLSQMVYLILLEYDEEKIQELWERDEINFFIVAIINNQLKSSNSAYYKIIRKFSARSTDITLIDIKDE